MDGVSDWTPNEFYEVGDAVALNGRLWRATSGPVVSKRRTRRQRFWSRVAAFAAKRTGRAFVYGADVSLPDMVTYEPREQTPTGLQWGDHATITMRDNRWIDGS